MDIEFAINVSRVASDGFNRYGQFACNEPTIVALYQIRKYLRLPRHQPSFQGGFATQFVTLPNVATANAIDTEAIPHPARKQRRNCRRCIDKLQHDSASLLTKILVQTAIAAPAPMLLVAKRTAEHIIRSYQKRSRQSMSPSTPRVRRHFEIALDTRHSRRSQGHLLAIRLITSSTPCIGSIFQMPQPSQT